MASSLQCFAAGQLRGRVLAGPARCRNRVQPEQRAGRACMRVRTSSRGEVHSTAAVRATAPATSGACAPAGPCASSAASASYSGK